MNENTNTKSRGRPVSNVVLPEQSEFTVHDLLSLNSVTRVTAQKKLNGLVKGGSLVVTNTPNRWTPTIYRKNVA